MSGYRPRPYLFARMGPRAAMVVRRLWPAELVRAAELAAALMADSDPEKRAAGEELREWLESMGEAARQYVERQGDGRRDGSERGTAELVVPGPAAGSDTSLLLGPSAWLVVEEVAEALGVSTSYVKRLCRNRRLSATKAGGTWLIDPASVREHEMRRRPVA